MNRKMPLSSPKVVVIVLNWNGRDVTAECLDSLRKVVYRDFEVMVVDNGSTDGSAEFFRKNYPWVSLLENGENLGFAGGNNAGIRAALDGDFDYILLLNNDTIVDPGFLSHLVEAGEVHPDVGFLGPKIYHYDHPNVLWYAGGEISLLRGLSRHYGFREPDCGQYDEPAHVNFVTGCSFLVKCDVVRHIGLLDENLFCYSEDADWSLRAVKAGYKGWYVPASKVWHKVGAAQKGDGFSLYMGTRNAMYLVHKHASTGRFILFLPFFFSRWVLKNIVRSVLTGNYAAMRSVCSGFLAFWEMPADAGRCTDVMGHVLPNKGKSSTP